MMDHSQSERREHERVSIPDVKVFYRKESGFNFYDSYAGSLKLKDLALSGAKFRTNHYLKDGDTIDLEFLIPEEDILRLNGTVVWSHTSGDSGTIFGTKFQPFGRGVGQNSLITEVKLRQLLQKHGATDTPS